MIVTANPPIHLPLENLTRDQKREVRDWLEHELADCVPQDWHHEILAEREKQIASGKMKLIPLEQLSHELEADFP